MISDTHNQHDQIDLDCGDVLIHAGDATSRGTSREIGDFLKWYSEQDFAYKILIAGNHDWGFEKNSDIYVDMCKKYGIVYLNDSGYTVKDFDTGKDIKIWGSPVQPTFCDWAFNRDIEPTKKYSKHKIIKPHWDLIPNDTDILITHGPPKGVRDSVSDFFNKNGVNVGCPHLRNAVFDRVKPKLHIFGHIHEEHGVSRLNGILFVNASQLNDQYNVHYKPRTVEWKDNKPIMR